ncbi:hypothetical protein HZH68_012931 [Vespula germanica]|uniref:Receptor ligand binding region domain-containing protein n=1 Tax=Vespula germanica TaxID=30212 RepID=A0A834JHM5_VESGE|nr:hypothetical protein HZH68_012931 [Vespula germanica]
MSCIRRYALLCMLDERKQMEVRRPEVKRPRDISKEIYVYPVTASISRTVSSFVCFRPLLKQIKNSAESHIVLDCSTERIYDVLKQAQQIGMMSDYHSYLITSLDTFVKLCETWYELDKLNHNTSLEFNMGKDLHSVDLEEFKHGGTNITAFRLVDPEKPEIQRVVQDWIYGEKRYNRELDMGQASNKDIWRGNGVKLNNSSMQLTMASKAACFSFDGPQRSTDCGSSLASATTTIGTTEKLRKAMPDI